MTTKPKKQRSSYLSDQIDEAANILAALTTQARDDAVRTELRNARQHAEMAMVLAGDWVPCEHLTEDEEREAVVAAGNSVGMTVGDEAIIECSMVDESFLRISAPRWAWLIRMEEEPQDAEFEVMTTTFRVLGSYAR